MNDQHENPYSPPRSFVTDPPDPWPPRRLWSKIYLWSLLALILLAYPLLFLSGAWLVQPLDGVDFIVTAVGSVGLFGFAYSRAIGRRGFWSGWLPFLMGWDLLVSFYFEPQGLAYAFSESSPTTLYDQLLGLALSVPLYAAIYLYAFNSQNIWAIHDQKDGFASA